LKELYSEVLQDNYFRNAPFLAYLRDHSLVPFEGGAFMQFAHVYAPMYGGFYSRGQTFNTAKPQTISGALFDPKLVEVNITEYLEDVEINNKGPLAYFSLLEADFQTAMNTINGIVAVAIWRHGQASGTTISDNRTLAVNGLSEVINNGLDNSWDGNIFANYGTQARNGAIGTAFNGNVRWVGNSTGGVGMITYNTLLEQYQRCRRGNDEPDIGVTNKAAYAYCLERIQPQQRFGQERDPIWGASGIKFLNAFILADDYAPSQTSQFGVNDPVLGNYSTGTFTSASSGLTAASGLPTSQTITVGEVFFWLNTRKFLLRISNSPLFGFGFKPFIYSADNTRVSGQVLGALNLECIAPWSNVQIYGIGS
jgi:hypothetical protein